MVGGAVRWRDLGRALGYREARGMPNVYLQRAVMSLFEPDGID